MRRVPAQHLDGKGENVFAAEGVRTVVAYAKALAVELIGREIEVRIANKVSWPFAATFGPSGVLTLNFGRLGYAFFKDGRCEPVDDLLIHEFAHNKVSDHLSADYYRECTRLGAKMVQIALDKPELMRDHELAGAAAV